MSLNDCTLINVELVDKAHRLGGQAATRVKETYLCDLCDLCRACIAR